MDEPTRPDEQPTIEAEALPGEDPDRLREQARELHQEAGERARAAAELRDAAAALRDDAAALLARVPEPAAGAGPPRDDSARAQADAEGRVDNLPALRDPAPRRRWFRRRG